MLRVVQLHPIKGKSVLAIKMGYERRFSHLRLKVLFKTSVCHFSRLNGRVTKEERPKTTKTMQEDKLED